MQPILLAKGLCKSFKRRQVVREVSLDVAAGEIVGLLGPNGAGKSTTFNIIAGLLAPDSGSVSLGEQQLGSLPLHRRARLGLGYLPQEATVFRGLTVLENFIAILELQGPPKIAAAACVERASELVRDYNLEHVRDSRGGILSGGERRRVEMARALIPAPRVVLLDEPFAGIDPIAVTEIKGFIRGMRDRGIGVLLTDHNVRETLRICDRSYLISEGRILLSGTPQEIIADDQARRTYLGEDFRL